MGDTKNSPDVINIEFEEQSVGKADELPARDRARLTLARWFLVALGVLMLASWILLIWCPDGRVQEAREIFNFVKTVVPPLITLVIGFYFNAQGD